MRIEDYNFWKVVAALGWGTKSTDYVKLRRKYKKHPLYSPKEHYEMFCTYRSKMWGQILGNIGRGTLSIPLGDDGVSDLIAHIIGLGSEAYFTAMENPKLIELRANAPYGSREGFKESFVYVFA